MTFVMDSREAVAWLDIYSDNLVSMSLLVRADTQQDEPDDEICQAYEDLRIALVEKRREARLLVQDILTAKGLQPGASDPLVEELNAAIQRYVIADKKADASLKPVPETYSQTISRIEREQAAVAKAAKEAKENKVASPTSPTAASDPASPGADAGAPSS